MTFEDRVRIASRELRAMAYSWRLDWSEFDGQSLLAQVNEILGWMEGDNPNELTGYTDDLKKQQDEF